MTADPAPAASSEDIGPSDGGSRILLRFPDPELERAFTDYYNVTYVVQYRFALTLAATLMLCDIAVDIGFQGDASSRANWFRLATFVPLAALGVGLSFLEPVRRRFQPFVVLFMLAIGASLFASLWILEAEGGPGVASPMGLLNFVFIEFFTFVIMGLQFRNSLFPSAVLFVAYLALVHQSPATTPGEAAYHAYHATTAVLLAAFIAYMRERYIRRTFLAGHQLSLERARSEAILFNAIPPQIARRLQRGEAPVADAHAEATILFGDLVGFTELARQLAPGHLVEVLNSIYSGFDRLADEYDVEKIKTIGDAYMAIGISDESRNGNAATRTVRMAHDMLRVVRTESERLGYPLHMRVGVHTGAVIAGVVGTRRLQYDVWGDAVNIASRLESSAPDDRVQVSNATYLRTRDDLDYQALGRVEIPDLGEVELHLFVGAEAD
ncbi:MAG: adenylate/guanylate cyclase domain-containing protein [Myxococcales bacterium]|nr:adenylate/guanylate cyclase domain-containing protein [Myxococcales bacterium]